MAKREAEVFLPLREIDIPANNDGTVAHILDAGHGSIRDVVYFIGAGPTRTSVAKTNSFVTHTIRRRYAAAAIRTRPKVQQLKDYVVKWIQFQSLWALEAEYALNSLGDSLAYWQQQTEIKRIYTTSDMTESQEEFGMCVVDYEPVQAHVKAKYDAWERDILSRFGVKLGNTMKEMHASIFKASRRAMTLSTSRLKVWWAAHDGSEGGVPLILLTHYISFRHLFLFSTAIMHFRDLSFNDMTSSYPAGSLREKRPNTTTRWKNVRRPTNAASLVATPMTSMKIKEVIMDVKCCAG